MSKYFCIYFPWNPPCPILAHQGNRIKINQMSRTKILKLMKVNLQQGVWVRYITIPMGVSITYILCSRATCVWVRCLAHLLPLNWLAPIPPTYVAYWKPVWIIELPRLPVVGVLCGFNPCVMSSQFIYLCLDTFRDRNSGQGKCDANAFKKLWSLDICR